MRRRADLQIAVSSQTGFRELGLAPVEGANHHFLTQAGGDFEEQCKR